MGHSAGVLSAWTPVETSLPVPGQVGIGVGRVGFTWSGATRISNKKEWPGWTPPAQMVRRQASACS